MEYVSKSRAAIKDVAGLLMRENGDVSFSGPSTVSTDNLVTSNSSPSRVFNIYGGVFNGAFNYNA